MAHRRYRTIQDEIRQMIADRFEAAGIKVDPNAPKPGSKAAKSPTIEAAE